jgi:hypothetical protein
VFASEDLLWELGSGTNWACSELFYIRILTVWPVRSCSIRSREYQGRVILALLQHRNIARTSGQTTNLNCVAKPPKTGSNWAPAQISKHWIQFQVEQTMFEPRLKFLKINEKKVNLINWFCKPVKIMFKKTSSHSRPRVDPLLPRHLLSSYCTVKSVSMD